MPKTKTMACILALSFLMSACGDGNDNGDNGNDNGNGGATPTPAASATPAATATAPPQIPCPQLITYTVQSEGSDLDIGWTGVYHDQELGTGGSLSFTLDCPGDFLGQCGDCALAGPIASTTIVDNQRCQPNTEVRCTGDDACGGTSCEFFFGAPLPISGGGVPICVTNQVDGPVTGSVQPELGSGTSNIGIIFTSYVGLTEDQPCPVCTGADVGATGTCQGGARDGEPCTTDGVTPFFGNTSFDCPPNESANIGSSTLPLNLTTGTREIAASATCSGPGGGACYCENQLQPNRCADGVCTLDDAGEGTCQAGPTDSLCELEHFRGCGSDDDCPAAGDRCVTELRGCLGPTDGAGALTGPVGRTGAPSREEPLQVSAFCIGDTRSGAVNTAAGLPGPGTILIPTTTCVFPSCPPSEE